MAPRGRRTGTPERLQKAREKACILASQHAGCSKGISFRQSLVVLNTGTTQSSKQSCSVLRTPPDEQAPLPNGKRIAFDDALGEIEGGPNVGTKQLKAGVDPPHRAE